MQIPGPHPSLSESDSWPSYLDSHTEPHTQKGPRLLLRFSAAILKCSLISEPHNSQSQPWLASREVGSGNLLFLFLAWSLGGSDVRSSL